MRKEIRFIDIYETEVRLGLSRSGYIRIDLEGEGIATKKHPATGEDVPCCISMTRSQAAILIHGLRELLRDRDAGFATGPALFFVLLALLLGWLLADGVCYLVAQTMSQWIYDEAQARLWFALAVLGLILLSARILISHFELWKAIRKHLGRWRW